MLPAERALPSLRVHPLFGDIKALSSISWTTAFLLSAGEKDWIRGP
jgi:hypothetical protein